MFFFTIINYAFFDTAHFFMRRTKNGVRDSYAPCLHSIGVKRPAPAPEQEVSWSFLGVRGARRNEEAKWRGLLLKCWSLTFLYWCTRKEEIPAKRTLFEKKIASI